MKPGMSAPAPMSLEEARALGWDGFDVILITGDAYVDHPSFGAAIIARILMAEGLRVGVIAQPDWRSTTDFLRLGIPRLFVGVTSGNVDSMVNHYTPAIRIRRSDEYTPGGKAGLRPNRATTVYANRCREVFKGIPIVLGGLEASLRRMAHYDYWKNTVRRSVLLDAKADILVYGSGERQIVEIARRLSENGPATDLSSIPGTVTVIRDGTPLDAVELPSYEEVANSKESCARAFGLWYRESCRSAGAPVVQAHEKQLVCQWPVPKPMTTGEIDAVYALPYTRLPHPSYKEEIPAWKTTCFSITSHRGCFGECAFCALAVHQGRPIAWRSARSIVNEAKAITRMKAFRGHITDIGGPTANMYALSCANLRAGHPCGDKHCLTPEICASLETSHDKYLSVLREVRKLPGVKRVTVGSGVRYDLIGAGREGSFLEQFIRHHVSGQLKVAPEHVSNRVLEIMNKPRFETFEKFERDFKETNRRLGLKQFLVPYLISGHPGTTLADMLEDALWLSQRGITVEQVQDFTPTPGTIAGCMHHTSIDPLTGKKVRPVDDPHEKRLQRALLQCRMPKNEKLVMEALKILGRTDLAGKLLGKKSKPNTSTAKRKPRKRK